MLDSKKQQVIDLVKLGDYKKALGIAKNFVRDFDKDEQRTIQIAYETLSGNGSMYKMLKIDTDEEIEKAKELMDNYGK